MQYLNWKVTLMVKTYLVDKSVAVHLFNKKLIRKVPILLHTGQNECSVLTTAVYTMDIFWKSLFLLYYHNSGHIWPLEMYYTSYESSEILFWPFLSFLAPRSIFVEQWCWEVVHFFFTRSLIYPCVKKN